MTVPRTGEQGRERRVALLMRVATAGSEGSSRLEEQRRYLHAYCHARGWTITREYSERRSGTTPNRPGLQRALADAEQGCFDVLLVHRLNRLSRKTAEIVSIADRLASYGVALVSATQLIDTQAPLGRMMMSITDAYAELEHVNAARRRRWTRRRRADS